MTKKVAGSLLVLLLVGAIAQLSVAKAAKYRAEPPELGFRNNMVLGEEETKLLTLENISGGALFPKEALIHEASIFNVANVGAGCLVNLGNGETCQLNVTFKPSATNQEFGGSYELEPKAVGGPWVTVKFSGGTKRPCG